MEEPTAIDVDCKLSNFRDAHDGERAREMFEAQCCNQPSVQTEIMECSDDMSSAVQSCAEPRPPRRRSTTLNTNHI